MPKLKLNWKILTIALIIIGLAVVFSGLGISQYANNQYTATKNKLLSIAHDYQSQNSFWTSDSAWTLALQKNPSLASLMDTNISLAGTGVSVTEIGGVIIAFSIVLFFVQRQFIKTIDNRIKQSRQTNTSEKK